jgi:hypothetical protein
VTIWYRGFFRGGSSSEVSILKPWPAEGKVDANHPVG